MPGMTEEERSSSMEFWNEMPELTNALLVAVSSLKVLSLFSTLEEAAVVIAPPPNSSASLASASPGLAFATEGLTAETPAMRRSAAEMETTNVNRISTSARAESAS